MYYRTEAKKKDFSSFFPSSRDTRYFESLDEAYEFIGIAEAKLVSSTGKNYTQGLGAKLSGKMNPEEKRVSVAHFFGASGNNGTVNLSNPRDLEAQLNEAISVVSIYLVFYGDRAISISNFYLDSRYVYSSNSQITSFNFEGNRYDATYPIGWNNEKVFRYLKKELD